MPALELTLVMARKTWVLDTETKGTGANVVPLEKVVQKPDPPAERTPRRSTPAARRDGAASPAPERARRRTEPVERSATALPPGHVRKRGTGEIGKVQSIDARAGNATVLWLKRGSVSTVPLSAVSRR
jgi:hypothetical protein